MKSGRCWCDSSSGHCGECVPGLHGSIPRSPIPSLAGRPTPGARLGHPGRRATWAEVEAVETPGRDPGDSGCESRRSTSASPPPRSSSSAGRAPARRAGGRGIEAHLDHDALLDPVAQLGRAPVSRAGGRGIEAHLDHTTHVPHRSAARSARSARAGTRSASLMAAIVRIGHRDTQGLSVSRAAGCDPRRWPRSNAGESTWDSTDHRAPATPGSLASLVDRSRAGVRAGTAGRNPARRGCDSLPALFLPSRPNRMGRLTTNQEGAGSIPAEGARRRSPRAAGVRALDARGDVGRRSSRSERDDHAGLRSPRSWFNSRRERGPAPERRRAPARRLERGLTPTTFGDRPVVGHGPADGELAARELPPRRDAHGVFERRADRPPGGDRDPPASPDAPGGRSASRPRCSCRGERRRREGPSRCVA